MFSSPNVARHVVVWKSCFGPTQLLLLYGCIIGKEVVSWSKYLQMAHRLLWVNTKYTGKANYLTTSFVKKRKYSPNTCPQDTMKPPPSLLLPCPPSFLSFERPLNTAEGMTLCYVLQEASQERRKHWNTGVSRVYNLVVKATKEHMAEVPDSHAQCPLSVILDIASIMFEKMAKALTEPQIWALEVCSYVQQDKPPSLQSI